jgi:serine/threonine-protein kinase
VIQSLTGDRPVPLDLVNPDLPGELVDLVHHLLEKDPADRPPTALAVMNRLKAMRVGLERARTVVTGGGQTEVITDGEQATDTGTELGSEPITSDGDDATGIERKKASVSRGGTSKPSAVSPSNPTVASVSPGSRTVRPDGSVADDETDGRVAKTHFQTVTDDVPTSGVFHDADREPTTAVTHWLAVAGMIGILIVGGGLLIYAMLPPSADQLYQTAVAGDMGAMNTFLRRFPDDPRHQEIFDKHMAGRLRGVLNRLATQAKLGVTPLDAAEEGFVSAMDGREQEPLESMERLQHWLNVYDSFAGESDPDLKELVELAKYERSQLELRAPAIIVDPRAEELIDDIERIIERESPELVRKKLTGIIKTFGNDDWAKPAVEAAQNQLQTLEESSEPDS